MDMKHPKIIVAGIGPGNESDITPAVISALQESDVVVGYKYYFQFVTPYLHPSTACIDTGMKRERARAEQAFELAEQGKTVCVISSGDAGIYGMTPLVYEMKRERNSDVEIVSLPGISAFQKAASLLGAPVGHDFCVISLSDLMTPWERIERRITAAAAADFVTAVYNPKSEGRYWQLYRLKELFLQEGRSPETPRGICAPGRTPGTSGTHHHAGRFQSRRGGYVYSRIDRQLTVLRMERSLHHSARLLPGHEYRSHGHRARHHDSQFPYHRKGTEEQAYSPRP